MATEIQLSAVLPLLETILQQQDEISQWLGQLTQALTNEPEPVAHTLRTLLRPLREGLSEMKETLVSQTLPEGLTTSTETGSSAPPTA